LNEKTVGEEMVREGMVDCKKGMRHASRQRGGRTQIHDLHCRHGSCMGFADIEKKTIRAKIVPCSS
jgi:hypothetical protein